MPHTRHHRLVRLVIVGGFFDGARFDFASQLNCLIGARGAGKTTVLEFLRYVLDAMPPEPAARERIEELVQRNLGGGRIELTVRTSDGVAYVVSRSPGEAPIVSTADGRVTDLSPGTGFLRLAAFSQNEVESIADRHTSQLVLLDHFEPECLGGIERQIADCRHALQVVATRVAPLRVRLGELTEELKGRGTVDEQLATYAGVGGASADRVNQAHALKALRDREARAFAATTEVVVTLARSLEGFRGTLGGRCERLITSPMRQGPNAALLECLGSAVAATATRMDGRIAATLDDLLSLREGIAAVERELVLAHKGQEVAFQALMAEHTEAQEKAAERSRLEKRRNELLDIAQAATLTEAEIADLDAERQRLIDRLSELRDQRFAIRAAIAERINDRVGPAIRVHVAQCGDRRAYQDLIENALRRTGVQPGLVARKVAGSLAPPQLAALVRAQDRAGLREAAGLNENQIGRLLDTLADEAVLTDIEAVELADRPTIELNDHGTYKETTTLSTGQKCTAILPILLIDSDGPLLIDQPEDNLDNRFVYEHIVTSLHAVKRSRQLVFVTHNPNIPVLGEAERVFVLDSDGTSGRMRTSGTVDDCRGDIINLLEGGDDAFRLRAERYAQTEVPA